MFIQIARFWLETGVELKFVAESREKLQFMLKFGTRVCLGCGKTETQRKGRLVPSALLRCC